MAKFCLPLLETKKFLQSLKDGSIDPEKMSTMSSEERRDYLEPFVGAEHVKEVNALFESKLLLKNQQAGMITWIKKVGGLSEVAKRDIVSRIERMDNILDAPDQHAFLEDVAAQKLGTEVTFDEAKQISEMSKAVQDAKSNLTDKTKNGSAEAIDYGSKKVALQEYVNELKLANEETGIKAGAKSFVKSPGKAIVKATSDIAGIAKGLKASLDNSALFRQGWKTLFTNPIFWERNAIESFKDIGKQLGKSPSDNGVLNAVKADVYSRENARNGLYQKAKLDIGTGEEAYPNAIPEKIPLFGRLYKASETAYTGFLMRMRADIFDKYIDLAKDNGVDLTDEKEVRAIGKLVNSLTGRGDLGSVEKIGKHVNTVFFSPKLLVSNVDFLTAHMFRESSTFARVQAAKNLLKVIAGTAVILGTAKALNPDSVELDPRSADFGKIKIGDTRFDVTGGMDSILTLAARIVSQSSKSSTTGQVTKLNTGKFGSQTGLDVAENFAENKLSPAAQVLSEIFLKHADFQGNPITVQGEGSNLLLPLPIQNAMEVLNSPDGANVLATIIADGLGINTNTYAPKAKKRN